MHEYERVIYRGEEKPLVRALPPAPKLAAQQVLRHSSAENEQDSADDEEDGRNTVSGVCGVIYYKIIYCSLNKLHCLFAFTYRNMISELSRQLPQGPNAPSNAPSGAVPRRLINVLGAFANFTLQETHSTWMFCLPPM